ncbi:YjhX family toxin [Pseudovibrio ascidiaceicola]|uniref:YjhX family toxin n=1 Tax=Pseudovibrio ascidiaceicola TaxID=285279 RepID=UPI000D697B0D
MCATKKSEDLTLDISKAEQCRIHVLEQNSRIEALEDEHGKIIKLNCTTCIGWHYNNLTNQVSRKLQRTKRMAFQGIHAYQTTRLSLPCMLSS